MARNTMVRTARAGAPAGVMTAVLTPFDEGGRIDFRLLERHLRYLSAAGVDGLFLAGTTGEGAWLTAEERRAVFTLAREVAGERTLSAAFIRPDTDSVVGEMRAFADLEPDFVSAVPPFYHGATQQMIVDHFLKIAEAAPARLILYNIPQNTQNALTLESVRLLARHERIVGIKESSGDFVFFSKGILETDGPFAWIQGKDVLDGPSLLLGAPALVTGLGNVYAEPYVALSLAAAAGDADGVLRHQRLINRLDGITAIAGGRTLAAVKAAASILGRSTPRLRLGGGELGRDQVRGIEELLTSLAPHTEAHAC